ncbi:hypothetical protein C8R43DRAFT_965121 [Mycena crocata]|nr:hypothetical protein C8R43DRAFT_965121 [Mycena crocata]
MFKQLSDIYRDQSRKQEFRARFVAGRTGRRGVGEAARIIQRERRVYILVLWLNENGWPNNGIVAFCPIGIYSDCVHAVYGPTATPFSDSFPHPKEMSEDDMKRVEDAFAAAAERCKQIGFDFIELHGAHGYLIHSFLSPVSNTRTDQYGGSLENRMRFPTRVLERMRAVWADKPLFVRISSTDCMPGPEKAEDGTWLQWGMEQSKVWLDRMVSVGVIDLLDASSGGTWSKQVWFQDGPGFQVPFSEAFKKAHPELVVGAVGNITDVEVAESYLADGKADVIFLARELLRNPDWVLSAAKKLGCTPKAANQYMMAWL